MRVQYVVVNTITGREWQPSVLFKSQYIALLPNGALEVITTDNNLVTTSTLNPFEWEVLVLPALTPH